MKYASAIVMLLIVTFCSPSFANEDWEQIKGIQEVNIQDISVSPFDSYIYASTGRTLYRSDDKGNNWKAVFSGQGEDSEINFTGIFEKGVFICAENGVFKSENDKLALSSSEVSNWKRISVCLSQGTPLKRWRR